MLPRRLVPHRRLRAPRRRRLPLVPRPRGRPHQHVRLSRLAVRGRARAEGPSRRRRRRRLSARTVGPEKTLVVAYVVAARGRADGRRRCWRGRASNSRRTRRRASSTSSTTCRARATARSCAARSVPSSHARGPRRDSPGRQRSLPRTRKDDSRIPTAGATCDPALAPSERTAPMDPSAGRWRTVGSRARSSARR